MRYNYDHRGDAKNDCRDITITCRQGMLFSDYPRCMRETMSLKLCVDTEPGSVASIA